MLNKNSFSLNELNIDDILRPNRICSGEKNHKYFIDYINDYKIKPFITILPKLSACVKSYDDRTKWMHFLIEDEELLKIYTDIWNKGGNRIKKKFNNELI